MQEQLEKLREDCWIETGWGIPLERDILEFLTDCYILWFNICKKTKLGQTYNFYWQLLQLCLSPFHLRQVKNNYTPRVKELYPK